jgi:hypothetical protein
MKCPPGCRVAMTLMVGSRGTLLNASAFFWELNLERIGATVTISQSRRRSSVAYLRGQAIRVYAV